MIESLQPNPDLLVRHEEFLEINPKERQAGGWVRRTPCVLERPSKNDAGRLPGPPGKVLRTRKCPVTSAPNYLSGRTEHCRAAFPCLAKTRRLHGLISLVRGRPERQGRGKSNIVMGERRALQARREARCARA